MYQILFRVICDSFEDVNPGNICMIVQKTLSNGLLSDVLVIISIFVKYIRLIVKVMLNVSYLSMLVRFLSSLAIFNGIHVGYFYRTLLF